MDSSDINSKLHSYSYKFASRINPTKRFEIKPINKDDCDAVVDQIATSFTKEDPISLYLSVTREMSFSWTKAGVDRSIEENLAVMCVDQESGQLAMTAIAYDIYNFTQKPFFGGLEFEQNQEHSNLLEENEKDVLLDPKQFNDVVELWSISTVADYQGLGLAQDVMDWLVKSHPILSKTKIITISATHPGTKRIIEKNGWQIRKRTGFLEYRNKKGEATFEGITAFAEKNLQLKNYTEIYHGIYLH